MKKRFAFFLAALILPLQSYTQARILIESRFQTGGEGLSGIVERCAALAAGREGFEAAYPGEGPEGAPLAALLRCDSSLDKGDYSLKLALFAPGGDQAALAEAGLSGRLSLDFDDRLIAAVRGLLSAASLEPSPEKVAGPEPKPEAHPDEALEAELAELVAFACPERAAFGTAGGEMAGKTPLEEPLPTEPAAPAPVVLTAPPPTPSLPPPVGARVDKASSTRLALSFASAPLFIVGPASEYFRYGVDASCSLGLRFEVSSLRLEAGLRAGYDLVYSAGPVAGELHLASLGVELKGSWPAEALFSLRLRAGGGPLYLAAASESAGFLGKLLPFCSAGLGLDFKPVAGFSLGLEAGALVAFERSLPLFALVPGLSAAWRL